MTRRPGPKNHLVIFAKAPRLGRVKSRLARDIGRVAAVGFYRRVLAGIARPLARDPRWTCRLAVTPDGAAGHARPWPVGCGRIAQGPGDLGARMQRVMASLPPGPVVIVGSDIPGIRPDHVAAAFRALGRNDAVFGPAGDGGYWLVGLRRRPRPRRPFADVRWSTDQALADTLANLGNARVALIDELDDVDDGAGLARWQAQPQNK